MALAFARQKKEIKYLSFQFIRFAYYNSTTMKLHYSSCPISVATNRKLKSVIAATDSKVEEVTYKGGDDISKLSAFNTLPLLETPEGTIFSSNAIARYLASTNKKELYGNGNIYCQGLIDQFLDFATFELEPAVRGVSKHQHGQKVDFGKLMEEVNKFLTFLEKQLGEKKFLVGDSLSIADLSIASSVSVIFESMFGEGQRKKYPTTVNWYGSVVAANKQVGPAQLPKQAHEAFRGGKKGGEKKQGQKKQDKKKEEKKVEKKQQKKEEKKDDDLFGDDDNTAPAQPVAKPAPKQDKKKKEKPVAKSIVVFDVKVYEQETDLNQLFQKIKQIHVDGLVWNGEPKIVPVAFGMNKLQVGCVVEDAKVSLEDLYEQIEGWEEVQSTDTVSFQKL